MRMCMYITNSAVLNFPNFFLFSVIFDCLFFLSIGFKVRGCTAFRLQTALHNDLLF